MRTATHWTKNRREEDKDDSLVALRFEGVSFLAQFDQSGEGGFAFRGFFAFALTAREFDAVVLDGAFEEAIMIGSGRGDDVILWRLRGKGLQQFLEFAFRIFERGDDRQRTDYAMKLAKNEFTGGLKAAVEKNRAEKRFESVRQSGGTFATAVQFFASTQDEMFAQTELASMVSEGASIDQLGASFGERAFAKGRKILIELASENELEDSITEEFEALVGLDRHALFVSD